MAKIIEFINAKIAFEIYNQSENKTEWLATLLKKHPAAHHISWVKDEIAKYYSNGDWDNLKKLTPGRGERKNEPALKKCYIDFLIFERVRELMEQGYNLTGGNGCLRTIEASGIRVGNEVLTLSFDQLKDRYYRFRNSEPVKILDKGKWIVGPTRMEATSNGKRLNIFGFYISKHN